MIVNFFSETNLNQFIKTLISFIILLIANLIYKFTTVSTIINFKELILLICLSVVIGCVSFDNDLNLTELNIRQSRINSSALYGLMIGLFFYIGVLPFKQFNSYTEYLTGICFGIVSCVLASLFTHWSFDLLNI